MKFELHHRYLVKAATFGIPEVVIGCLLVDELSPSGEYVKLINDVGDIMWSEAETTDYEIIEILNPSP